MNPHFTILLISSEQDIADEAETVNKLFDAGLGSFHLRKPHWDIKQTQRFIETIPMEFHDQIVLHSQFQLTEVFNLKGIHLNEANKKVIEQFGKSKIISASFHSLRDLKENTFPYRYVFLGPVFNSISKPGYNAKFDLKLLAEELKTLNQQNYSLPKIIALGGIDSVNIIKIKKTGFSGAALLGAVWQSQNPTETFLQIKSMTGVK